MFAYGWAVSDGAQGGERSFPPQLVGSWMLRHSPTGCMKPGPGLEAAAAARAARIRVRYILARGDAFSSLRLPRYSASQSCRGREVSGESGFGFLLSQL